MSEHLPISDEFLPLLNAACDGTLDGPQLYELAAVLDSDESMRKLFARHVQLRTDLRLLCRAEMACDGGLARVQAMLPETSPSVSPILPSLGDTMHGTIGYFSSGWPVAYLVATVIFGLGLLAGALVQVSTPVQVVRQSVPSRSPLAASPSSRMEFVGRITGMLDCQWADPNTAVPGPVAVPLGRKYALSSGLLEITYDTGAKVILQGPCTYKVESPAGGFLALGKLTATVENKQERRTKNEELSASSSSFLIPHSYFAVRTPTATVTDLGTEFGVEVSKQGNTTSHVFRGSVSLQMTGGDKGTSVAPLVLRENESARVEQSGDTRVIVSDPSAKPAEFVRKLVKPIIKTFDLVDVVAGGDGFSGRRNRGIDPSDGRAIDSEVGKNPTIGDGEYHRVTGMPFVDGVFIPHNNDGSVQLDSAGHRYAWFPATDNKTCNIFWAGQAGNDTAELDGIDYASPGHGHLEMDANKGITFDLQAIRAANPDYKLLRFRAVTGNTEEVSQNGAPVYADVWVFVDGQSRFQRREINRFNGAMPVTIPINDNDRFLTLVATDGGNGYGQDHVMFGDPRLELVPAKAAAEETPPREAAEP